MEHVFAMPKTATFEHAHRDSLKGIFPFSEFSVTFAHSKVTYIA